MSLVKAKCTNCGATLTVDNQKDAAVCQYCGTAYIVEKAIQHYNYNITNNITADKVVVTGKGNAEKERLLQNAKTNERFSDYDKATIIYEQITEDYPDEYRGWLGLASMTSKDFKKVDLNYDEFTMLSSNMQKAIQCAPPDKVGTVQSQWDSYVNSRDEFIGLKKSELRSMASKANMVDNKIVALQKSYGINANRSSFENETLKLHYKLDGDGKSFQTLSIVIGFVLLFAGLITIQPLVCLAGVVILTSVIISYIHKCNKLKKLLIGQQHCNELRHEKSMIQDQMRFLRSKYHIE